MVCDDDDITPNTYESIMLMVMAVVEVMFVVVE